VNSQREVTYAVPYLGKAQAERRDYDYGPPKTVEEFRAIDQIINKLRRGVLDKRFREYLEHTGQMENDPRLGHGIWPNKGVGTWPNDMRNLRAMIQLALFSDFKRVREEPTYDQRDPRNPDLWDFFTGHHRIGCNCWHCSP
jgi:hypothetical protein